MADIEDAVARVDRGFAMRDFMANLINVHVVGEDAVVAEPQEHSRWILMCLLIAGGAFTMVALFFLVLNDYSFFTVCVAVGFVSCGLILVSMTAVRDCQDGFQHEDNKFLDVMLQL